MWTTLAIAVVAVCVFMVAQDILGTALVVSESRGLKWFPGIFDGLGDFANRYGGAIVAVASVHFGLWAWPTLVIVVACAITSFFTSNFATGKASLILPKNSLDHVSWHEAWKRLRGK